jgi:basic amino acid/polyamine antiporter, APA family
VTAPTLQRRLTLVEYFAFGFGSMVGVGWLVLIDDWLGRGGPAGAVLGFLVCGLALIPIALTYGRLARAVPDAGAEVAYAEGVFAPPVSFAAGWTMVLAYAIVCPWEAVAIGNLLARVFPELNSAPLWVLAGKPIYAPRVVAGLLLTGVVAAANYRGIRQSGLIQDVTTYGLLLLFVVFAALGFARGSAANLPPVFARPGGAGAWLSILLVLQVVPYFMTGFESVAKGAEESRPGFDPRGFSRAMLLAVVVGTVFYVTVVAVVAWVFPWRELVAGKLGSEQAFQRAFGSRAIAQVVLAAAFLSLLKVFNGNFVAATRLMYALGRRGLVHPGLARVHPRFGTPTSAVLLLAALTAGASLLGDAVLVPITDVGSLAVGVGWLSACVAALVRLRRGGDRGGRTWAAAGAVVSLGIIAMKLVPAVPGSFGRVEWAALGGWLLLGVVLWLGRRRPT